MAVYCTNRHLHRRPYRLWGRVYYWNHRAMCRRCYNFFCRNIRVVRPPQPPRVRRSMVHESPISRLLRILRG